jgi:AcrR family transcriptional regulator
MEKTDQKREQILDAAMRCLARFGMMKVTLDDIAKLMGMNKASLYYYYENKEALFIDALERESLRFFELVQQNFAAIGTVTEKFYSMVRTFHVHFRNRAEVLELNVKAMSENHGLIQKLDRRLREKNIDFLRDLIQQGIDAGEFRGMDAGRVARIVRIIFDLSRLEQFLKKDFSNHEQPDFVQMENDAYFILDLLFNGLKTNSLNLNR